MHPVTLDPAAPPDVPGLLLGSLLGRGASSSVWAAVRVGEHGAGEAVAVKVTRPERYHVGQLLELAARESAILTRVGHEHLVRLHEAHPLADGSVAVVLDIAAGGDLARLVAERGRLEPGEVATICTPLAGALAALHVAGVVHGDLAPGNVLFTADGRPLLADFEAARLVGEGHPPVVAGTPGFVAPEVLDGELPSEASDLYGLGALAWFALTGTPLASEPGAGGRVRPPDLDEARRLAGPGFAPLLVALLAADPAERPGADEAAVACYQSAEPLPVRLVSMPTSAPAGPLATPDGVSPSVTPGGVIPPAAAKPREPATPGRDPVPPDPVSPDPVPPDPASADPWHGAAGDPGPSGGAPTPGPAAPRRPPVETLTQRLRQPDGGLPPAAAPGPPGRTGPTSRSGRHAARRTAAGSGGSSGGGSGSVGRRVGSTGIPTWGRVVLILVAAVALGILLIALLARAAPPAGTAAGPTTAAPSGSRAPTTDPLRGDPVAVLATLAQARASALVGGDPADLLAADAPGSPQLASDTAILEGMRAKGQRYAELSFTVRSAEWVGGTATSAKILAVVDRSAYRVLGPDAQAATAPADVGRPLTYTLVRTDAGWRIADVTP